MDSDARKSERAFMVEQQIHSRGISHPAILAAMRKIPRHFFVPAPYDTAAYSDAPLPIGDGQTISQPYIVARMTELLNPSPDSNILEIGAGSGYQAAILSTLVRQVTTVERLPQVAERAKRNLAGLGLENVRVLVGDGTMGCPEYAPFDGILITAATPDIPGPLIEQLGDKGILVAPVGDITLQELVSLKKTNTGIICTSHGGVRFVPLIGKFGWHDT